MSGVHGPVTGYDYFRKRRYRQSVWEEIESRLRHIPRKDRQVAILESQEGEEAKFLMLRGYRPQNVHAINVSPAVAATLTKNLRKDGWPRVSTHGQEASEALKRLGEQGTTLHALNLDFCSNIHVDLMRRLAGLSFSPVYRDGLVIAMTLLRGRERDAAFRSGADIELLKGTPDDQAGDQARLHLLNLVLADGYDPARDQWWCRYHLVNPVVRRYPSTSGTQSMLWFVATVRTHATALTGGDLRSVVELVQRWRTGWGDLDPFMPLCVEAMQARHASLEDYFLQCWGSMKPDQPWACIGAPLPDRTEAFQAFRAQLPTDLRTAYEAAARAGVDPAAAQTLRQLMKAGVRLDPVALANAGVRIDPALELPPFVPRFEEATPLPVWRHYVRVALAAIERGYPIPPLPPELGAPSRPSRPPSLLAARTREAFVGFLNHYGGDALPEDVVEACWQDHQRRIRVLEAFERGEVDADAVALACCDEMNLDEERRTP